MQYPWLRQYPQGVPAEVPAHDYISLVDLLNRACKKYASRPVASSFGVELSFSELDQQAQAFAGWLHTNTLTQCHPERGEFFNERRGRLPR